MLILIYKHLGNWCKHPKNRGGGYIYIFIQFFAYELYFEYKAEERRLVLCMQSNSSARRHAYSYSQLLSSYH